VSWLMVAWKFIAANRKAAAVTACMVAAYAGGWVSRGYVADLQLAGELRARAACEAEVLVWRGAADENDRARAALEATLRQAAAEWAKVAEELRKAGEVQRRELTAAAQRHDALWDRYRDSLTAALPTDCEGAVRETARRLQEVAR